jgi:hypothetical protein
MPLHLSHILQLLNIGCFTPLKQAYKKELRGLVDSHVYYINKKAFLATFKLIFNKAFLKNNILLSFQATSLVLHNLDVVLSRLKVQPRTPTLPTLGPTS